MQHPTAIRHKEELEAEDESMSDMIHRDEGIEEDRSHTIRKRVDRDGNNPEKPSEESLARKLMIQLEEKGTIEE